MRKLYYFLPLLTLLINPPVFAVEGWWQPQQLSQLAPVLAQEKLSLASFDINALQNHSLKAIVKLGNCSAAFVSDTGLLLTNYSCIAQSVTAAAGQRGLTLANGYTALQREAELPLANLHTSLITNTQNVTVQINRQIPSGLSSADKAEKISQISLALERECQQISQQQCEVSSSFDGLEYQLITSMLLTDVRLVHLPAVANKEALDNWSWPRYQADYVVLRAYQAAPVHSADQQDAVVSVFRPPAYLPLSGAGVNEGDAVVAVAFPRRSQRYSRAEELQFLFGLYYPQSVLYRQQAIELIEKLSDSDSGAAQYYQQLSRRLQHASHNEQNMLLRYQHSQLPINKSAFEQQLMQWINGSPVRQQVYGPVLDKLQRLNTRQHVVLQRDLVLVYLNYTKLPILAQQLYKLAKKRAAGNVSAAALDAEMATLRQQILSLPQQFDVRLDQGFALHFLRHYASLPQAARISALDHYFALNDGFNVDIVRHKLEAMYRSTLLNDPAQLLQWLQRSPAQFEHSRDSLINFAVAMYPASEGLAMERQQMKAELADIRRAYDEVIIAFNDAQGLPSYADSNATLRLSFGRVKGYQPLDAVWYQPFSTVKGLNNLLKRNIDTDDTTASLPVNFLSTNDSTWPDNSAVTLNKQGELVGLMFSGVAENQLAQWHYDRHSSRSVHMDIRYILWQLQQDQQNTLLLRELDIQR
ncbi:S46 family peptidase [Rheinheimera maricola]|uniref:Dipeptidyl-peptidase n=1 Tax=Rheinheimera maricola TaxID=2793282 RepID=A0ABS7X3E8_9GAMM|nr:S46 family peptidase [Rheinheimera maricola]MBZ9610089.1 S46 family peptidase [Rheinheimera maricola]